MVVNGVVVSQKSNTAGYTLIEVLITMSLLATIVFPMSIWFYKSTANQSAYKKYYAYQVLKSELSKVYLEEKTRSKEINLEKPYSLKIKIEVKNSNQEWIYKGIAKNKRGREMAALTMSRYGY